MCLGRRPGAPSLSAALDSASGVGCSRTFVNRAGPARSSGSEATGGSPMSLLSIRAGRLVAFSIVFGSLTAAAGAAQAHILLADPKPRDQNDQHKNDAMPCP